MVMNDGEKSTVESLLKKLATLFEDYDITPKSKIDQAEITRLKQKSSNELTNEYLTKINSEIKKWKCVIESDIGDKIDEKDYAYTAILLESQFKLHKGYLPESTLLTTHSSIIQNYALPIIRVLVPKLKLKLSLYDLFYNFNYNQDDIYVETIKLPSEYNISDLGILDSSEENNTRKYIENAIVNIIINKMYENNKVFARQLILSKNLNDEKIIYIRFILK